MVKYYKNGIEFYQDNIKVITSNQIETSFFKINAFNINNFSANDFCLKIINGEKELIALQKDPFNLLLFGDKTCISELAHTIYWHNMKINGVMASAELVDEFIKEYTELSNGIFVSQFDMGILISTETNNIDDAEIANDSDEFILNKYHHEFHKIIYKEELKKEVLINPKDYYVYRVNNYVVSMAKKVRIEDKICGISYVYTNPLYQGLGYAKKVVSTLRNDIVRSGKTAYLYVDNCNSISTHLYETIGFNFLVNRKEEKYRDGNIKRIVLAGGCFWCISSAFYNLNGVIDVYSGYAGGVEMNPSYEFVKSGNSSHMEAIMIIYDEKMVSFETLLKTYFENIDPFDGDGQFIDRGTNYQTAVFTNDDEEVKIFNKIVRLIENNYNKKVKVKLLNYTIFNLAEEEHQKYAIKNPDKIKIEEDLSGRNKYNKIKI